MASILAKADHTKKLNRDRQKRFYDANQEKINALKKQSREALMRPIQEKVIFRPDDSFENTPPNVFDEETVIQMINAMVMNEQTRRKKIANIHIIFKAYPTTDLKISLSHYDKMRYALENVKTINNPNETYGYETIKTIIQTILWCIINLNIPIKKEIFKQYETLVGILKQKSMEQKIESKNDVKNAVIPYAEYLDKIKNAFGEDSKPYLIASIYNILTARDDIASLIIFNQNKGLKNPDINIVYIPKTGNGKIILNKYKTQSKYGAIHTMLDVDLTNLIRNYILKHKLTDKLFGENYNNGLTSYISKMNKQVGIDGSINILRRMKITDFLQTPNLTYDQMADFANKSMHSLNMQDYYKYNQK